MSSRPRESTATQDLVRHNRHSIANAYRRLADEANRAAAALTDVDGNAYTDSVAHDKVAERVDSVRHARILLEATRTGYAKVSAAANAAAGGTPR